MSQEEKNTLNVQKSSVGRSGTHLERDFCKEAQIENLSEAYCRGQRMEKHSCWALCHQRSVAQDMEVQKWRNTGSVGRCGTHSWRHCWCRLGPHTYCQPYITIERWVSLIGTATPKWDREWAPAISAWAGHIILLQMRPPNQGRPRQTVQTQPSNHNAPHQQPAPRGSVIVRGPCNTPEITKVFLFY